MSLKESVQTEEIVYPDSDGKPMADNTVQFRWISKLKGALDYLFLQDEQVFVAGDLLWYPVQGQPKIRIAPDVMVAFGRPKGDRGSYKQWEERGIAPQVVIEVLSPSNTSAEMSDKLKFYYKYGAEEFYILDPQHGTFYFWQKQAGIAMLFPEMKTAWSSQKLGIQLEVIDGELAVFYPDGSPILSYAETKNQAEEHKRLANQERKAKEDALAEIERLKAEVKRRAD